jgi:hypothetical protein
MPKYPQCLVPQRWVPQRWVSQRWVPHLRRCALFAHRLRWDSSIYLQPFKLFATYFGALTLTSSMS